MKALLSFFSVQGVASICIANWSTLIDKDCVHSVLIYAMSRGYFVFKEALPMLLYDKSV